MNPPWRISTIDTHTAGGPTRIVLDGLPPLSGATAAERMQHFRTNHDAIRKFLLNEPRGHRGMYGAVVGPSADPEVDLSVFFMTTGGYLPTCVHGSIGVATAMLAEGRLRPRPDGNLYFDTPGGRMPLTPRYRDGALAAIALRTQPGAVTDPRVELEADGTRIVATAVFCGVPFLLVSADQLGKAAIQSNLAFFVELGMRLLDQAGPSFALALFYDPLSGGGFRDVVIGRTGGIDRSPCGAGVGALAIHEHVAGRLPVGTELSVTGVIGTRFTARVARLEAGGVVPEISGSAWITGTHRFVQAESDPLAEGFDLGR
ncbi:MAG: proline racemase family protein [Gemmatimonadales bacterium]